MLNAWKSQKVEMQEMVEAKKRLVCENKVDINSARVEHILCLGLEDETARALIVLRQQAYIHKQIWGLLPEIL